MCAPKGDTVAGDGACDVFFRRVLIDGLPLFIVLGVGKMETLPDYSLSLPSIGTQYLNSETASAIHSHHKTRQYCSLLS
jgi:hypothetical protein